MSSLTVGAQLASQTYRVTRADLVRYAGASGDFNPIHWNDRTARAVGLPGVIAHGMYTMALAGRAVTAWAGVGVVVEYGVRFAKPVRGAGRQRGRRDRRDWFSPLGRRTAWPRSS